MCIRDSGHVILRDDLLIVEFQHFVDKDERITVRDKLQNLFLI